jgi:Na+-driven multidrug efflux pump
MAGDRNVLYFFRKTHRSIQAKVLEIILFSVLSIFLIATTIGIFKGLDPKKWSSWLLGLLGFLCGFILGFFRADNAEGLRVLTNLNGSFEMGTLFAIIMMVSGITTRWQRNYFRGKADAWLSKYGQEKQYTFLANLIRRSKNKQK